MVLLDSSYIGPSRPLLCFSRPTGARFHLTSPSSELVLLVDHFTVESSGLFLWWSVPTSLVIVLVNFF